MTATAVPVGKYGRGTNKLVVSGLTPAVGNTVDGMTLANDGKTVVDVKNTNGASTAHDVTFNPITVVEGHTVTDPFTIPAGATWGFGPFPVEIYGTTMTITAAHAELTFLGRRLP
jgi:hypothetical protein